MYSEYVQLIFNYKFLYLKQNLYVLRYEDIFTVSVNKTIFFFSFCSYFYLDNFQNIWTWFGE